MTGEELMEASMLGLDDTFEFRCKACGKCCKQRQDLLLTPYDVFRIASHFRKTPMEIIEKYCEVYEGESSHMPVVRVLPVGVDDSCPFLYDRKCRIQIKKPVVCRVYPLARMFAADNEVEGTSRYYFNTTGCKHEPRTYTVREWIGDVASEEAEQSGKLWTEVMAFLYPHVLRIKEKSEEVQDAIFQALFGALYLTYETDKPFITQLQENFEKLKSLFEELERFYNED